MAAEPGQHPVDLRLSPYTGWTRAHWEAAADRMLLAVRPYAGPGNALISLPGPPARAAANRSVRGPGNPVGWPGHG